VLTHACGDRLPIESFSQQRVNERAVGIRQAAKRLGKLNRDRKPGANGVGNAASPASGSGKGVPRTWMDAAPGGRDGKGLSAPLSAARGSPS
jgi:hypothetical protein